MVHGVVNKVDIPTLVERLRAVVGSAKPTVPLHEPCFAGNEWQYVKDCLDTRWVSSVGAYVGRFEDALKNYTGAHHAVAVVNGTAALHACLMILDVQHDDEVLLPALTFVATANAVTYCGAVPHFVDVAEDTLGVDPVALRAHLEDVAELRADGCYNRITGRRIAALIPMHAFGHPVDLDALAAICADYRLDLIEDAAESLGSLYKERHTGTLGRVGALSFNGNKIVTTGGGGAILTHDAELAARVRHLTTTAKLPHAWEYVHDQIGYNYRLPNLNAALGLAQLEQLPRFVERKRALAQRYQEQLADVPGLRVFREPKFARSNYWLNLLLLDQANMELRDAVLQATHDAGLLARPAWQLLHLLPMYVQCPRAELSVAEDVAARLICLPSSVELAP
jgi:perosamine synthetase